MPNILFFDSFAHYTRLTDADDRGLTWKWSGVLSGTPVKVYSSGGRNGGGYVELVGNNNEIWKNLTNQQTLAVGGGFRFSTFPGTSNSFWQLRDGPTIQIELKLTAAGELQATRNGAVLGTTSGLSLAVNTWHHLQIKVYVHPTAGSVIVKVGNVPVLTLLNQNTRATANSWINSVHCLCNIGAASVFYSDFWIADDFCGDARALWKPPTANGFYADWTPTGAVAAWQCVDEVPPNDDTDYIVDATAGHKATVQTTASATGAVLAVQVTGRIRKDDAGAHQTRRVSHIGGVDYPSLSNYTVPDAYGMAVDLMNVNPATGLPWTFPQIDGAEVAGVELVS